MVSSFYPDVVILNLDMRGLDGFEVANALKQCLAWKNWGIFALSGWNDEAVRERCSVVGFRGFFSKPIPANQILFALADYG